MDKIELKDLGYDEGFEAEAAKFEHLEYGLARVVAVNKDNYIIRNECAELLAEITGKIMYDAESNLAFPAVGDWVCVRYFNENTLAIIHEVLPRKSLLKRKVAGKKIEFQSIAANIDTAFIVQSLDANFNLRRLERYLTMINDSNIKPVILLSKSDLISADKLEQNVTAAGNVGSDCQIIGISNKTGDGLDEVRELLRRGRTYCLLGSSGVGKTTLLNNLIGEDVFATGEVREKDGKGKHVTTRRELTVLARGGMIIDTPGMRELGNFGINSGIDETFKDIAALSLECRFADCTHNGEPGCAVIEAVEEGGLDKSRYENYLKIRKESEFYEMSYVEKRQKDKQFGKFIKNAKKTMRKKER